MSKKLDRESLGPTCAVFDAFDEANRHRDVLNDRAGFSVVYLRERFLEPTIVWGDPWKYGVSADRGTIERFARYSAEQGITRRQLSIEELFARGTLDT